VRPFGSEAGDLDVDFTLRPPFLATDLLRRCAALSDEAAWDLAVGARTETLAALAMLSEPGPLAIGLRCPRPQCREALEIDIEPGELRSACADREREHVDVRVGGDPMRLRRPTGRDQRAWLGTRWPDIETARRSMLASLLSAPVSRPLDASVLTALETELAHIDPLVDFTLGVACPACGVTEEHTVDLEQHALAALRRVHQRLFESVARLATRFHWTEADIFALPPWRRERYLALTEPLQ
jgi:hypothetical protein